jgi:hypothetical protein
VLPAYKRGCGKTWNMGNMGQARCLPYFRLKYSNQVNSVSVPLGRHAEKPIVVVTGPGPGSGKLDTRLTLLYHNWRRGLFSK